MSFKDNIGELMQKAQEMQKRMQDIQKQISDLVVVGKAGNNDVEVHMTGSHAAKRVKLSSALLLEEKDVIEELIVAAINDACTKIESDAKGKMTELMKNMQLPQDVAGGNNDV